jgi:hypothetical protein
VLHDDVIRFRVSGDQPAIVDMPTMWAHSITNVGTENLLTLFWANEVFDPVSRTPMRRRSDENRDRHAVVSARAGVHSASLALDLVGRGHHVRVLTGFPNYPSGKLYPGYRQRWNHVETIDGVTVRRVPLYLSHDSSGAHGRRTTSRTAFRVRLRACSSSPVPTSCMST